LKQRHGVPLPYFAREMNAHELLKDFNELGLEENP
jgi:hypothetical protein